MLLKMSLGAAKDEPHRSAARMVIADVLSPADLITFVNESTQVVNSLRKFVRHFTDIGRDMRDPLLLARFADVKPSIGLNVPGALTRSALIHHPGRPRLITACSPE